MELEEAIENIKEYIAKLDDYIVHLYDENGSFKKQKETYITILQEIARLQKENEELRIYRDNYKGCFVVAMENSISKDKIKELILSKKQKIQENNAEIEECRKTIMEEQELKKLKLYTLHKNNELLELEIADMFDLLKEE